MNLLEDRRGQVDMEVLFSPAFIMLTVIGYVAFTFMLFQLKAMDTPEIMSLWVKIITILAIPVVAYVFALMKSG